MNYETIQLEMRDAVCVLTLNRPERLNALNVQVGNEFKAAIAEAMERGARAIVITGAGRAFSAGGDLREMQEIAKKTGRVERFLTGLLGLLIEGLMLFRKPRGPFIGAVKAVE